MATDSRASINRYQPFTNKGSPHTRRYAHTRFQLLLKFMKTLLTTVIVLASSALLASANVVAKSHDEVTKQYSAVMMEVLATMGKISDKATAEAFAASLPDTAKKMQAILKAAQALPEPTEAEKTAYNKMMSDNQEKAEPIMMAMMMGLQNNPEAEDIGTIMGEAMQNQEVEKTGTAIDAIYEQEGEGEIEPPIIE